MIPSVEELLTEFISIGQEDVERAFKRGAIAYYLLTMGFTYTTLSSKVNCSPEQIRVLTKTFEAFPDETDRHYAELSYYHYRLAARTEDPHHWMKLAQENEWSTRELQKAIKSTPVTEEYREAERLLFKVKKLLTDPDIGEWFYDQLVLVVDEIKCVFESND